jgi:hypothetical protein
MKKYRIKNRWETAEIEEIEVARETAQSVFVLRSDGSECRSAKVSEWHQYHDTWESAHAELVRKANSKIEHATRELQRANDFFRSVNTMAAKS